MNPNETCPTPADIKHITASMLGGVYKDVHTTSALRGLSWGYNHLDSFTGGLQPGQLVVIGYFGCSTSFALNIVERLLLGVEPVGVCIFTLRSNARSILQQLCCSSSRDSSQSYTEKNNRIKFEAALERFVECPIHIFDNTSLALAQLIITARYLVEHSTIRLLVVVDDIQTLAAVDSDEPQECAVRKTSNSLRDLAKELKVAILVLSEARNSFDRDRRPPRLYDLEGSSAIEEDADVVVLLEDGSDNDCEQPWESHLYLAKNRNGPVARLSLNHFWHYGRYEEYSINSAVFSR